MASNGGDSGGGGAGRGRNRAVAVIAALGILAFAGGFLIANSGSDKAAPSPTAPSPTASRFRSTRPSPSPTATAAASPTLTPTSPPSSAALPDGRAFGLIVGAAGTPPGPVTVRVEVARFLTGDAADHAAAARGEPTPVPNDYFILDDHTRRSLPVAPSVKVRYIPENMCCETQPGTLDGFVAAVEGTAMTDYPTIATTYWWLTVKDGRVVAIEQQYLP
jgi:hypothetical protein